MALRSHRNGRGASESQESGASAPLGGGSRVRALCLGQFGWPIRWVRSANTAWIWIGDARAALDLLGGCWRSCCGPHEQTGAPTEMSACLPAGRPVPRSSARLTRARERPAKKLVRFCTELARSALTERANQRLCASQPVSVSFLPCSQCQLRRVHRPTEPNAKSHPTARGTSRQRQSRRSSTR